MKKLVSLCGAILLGGALSAEERPYSVATLPTWNNHGHNVQWNYIFKNAGTIFSFSRRMHPINFRCRLSWAASPARHRLSGKSIPTEWKR